ncbi:MAG: isoamylase early set domain-containing protein [Candidatus Omnitrophica bacterium]|nr:isoamylase early set domain-containing protein [Candidatus Omnitrophota bacterium]
MFLESYSIGKKSRYSAQNSTRSINFFHQAPSAKRVSLIGDFNKWQPEANPMQRLPDGGWFTRIDLHHGHHLYQFLVDGQPVLDPRAQGTARNQRGEKVSLIAVS